MPYPPSKKIRTPRLVIASVMLTSMMDMFTIILFFLLRSFVLESGEVPITDPKLRLPVSISREAPKLRLNIQVTTDAIVVEGAKVGEIKDYMKEKDLLIKPLYDTLNRYTENTEFIARFNPSVRFTGEVVLQGDKMIPFRMLEKVMYTCGQAGYSNISLAVISSR